MKLLIHDLSDSELEKLNIPKDKYSIYAADLKAAPCRGCFGCWTKSPGKCVYKDKLQYIGSIMAQCESIVVISKNCYGGYSAGIKRVFDRGIANSIIFFEYRGKKIHHMCRYRNHPEFTVYLYGDATDFEKQIATDYVKAHSINGNYKNVKTIVVKDISEIKGEI